MMRGNDFIGVMVYDSARVQIGKVHDLRLARDGQESAPAPYAVTHLLVAAGSLGTRLGYGYGHMHGPWPLSAIMERAMARGYAVRWDQIGTIEPTGEVRLSASRDDLMPMAQLVGDGDGGRS